MYVTGFTKTVGTFGILRNAILKIESTVASLCYIVATPDLLYKQSSLIRS